MSQSQSCRNALPMYMLRLHIELYHPSFVCWFFVGSVHRSLVGGTPFNFWLDLERVHLIGALPGFELLQQVLVRHQHGTSLDTGPHTTRSYSTEPACDAF